MELSKWSGKRRNRQPRWSNFETHGVKKTSRRVNPESCRCAGRNPYKWGGDAFRKLSAANMVFDRAIGKPKQAASVEVTHNASPHLTALVSMAAAVALRGTNVTAIDGQVIDNIEVGTYEPQKRLLNVDAETAEHGDE